MFKRGFYEPVKRSDIQIVIEKKKKPREISVLEEDQQALGLFVSKYPDKKKVFGYPLTVYPLAFSIAQGTFYKPHT